MSTQLPRPERQDLGLSRRRLLIGAATVGLLPACAPNDESTQTAPSVSSSPSVIATRLNVAVIGAGGQGKTLSRRLERNKSVRIATVCDPDSDRALELANWIESCGKPRPRITPDLQVVLADRAIDSVVIATPHHWHALAAIWAIQSGKHVYLEKPATHSMQEGQALLETWARSDVVVEVGTQRRSHPGLQEAIEAVHAGEAGDVELARCYSWKRRPSIGPAVLGQWPDSLDENLWFGPREIRRPIRQKFHYDWHWFRDFGNGGLGNNGVHRLDVARWGLQLPESGDEVLAYGGRLGATDAGETPNTFFTMTTFGKSAVIHDLRGMPTSANADLDPGMRPDDEVVFVGSGASIVLNRTGGRLVEDSGKVVRTFGDDAREVDPIARHLRGFVAACIAGKPSDVAVGLAEGIASAAMCHGPSSAHFSEKSRSTPVDDVESDVLSRAGKGAERALQSLLRHVQTAGGAAHMTYSGPRSWNGNQIAGVKDRAQYRAGFELPSL